MFYDDQWLCEVHLKNDQICQLSSSLGKPFSSCFVTFFHRFPSNNAIVICQLKTLFSPNLIIKLSCFFVNLMKLRILFNIFWFFNVIFQINIDQKLVNVKWFTQHSYNWHVRSFQNMLSKIFLSLLLKWGSKFHFKIFKILYVWHLYLILAILILKRVARTWHWNIYHEGNKGLLGLSFFDIFKTS